MLLTVVHFLHLAFAIAWAGGTLLWIFVLGPTLLRLEPDMLSAAWETLGPRLRRYLNAAGGLLILSGLARMVAGGGVTAFADLADAYGRHVLTALVILVMLAIIEARTLRGVTRILSADGDPRTALRPFLRRMSLLTAAGLTAALVLMTLLGLGYY